MDFIIDMLCFNLQTHKIIQGLLIQFHQFPYTAAVLHTFFQIHKVVSGLRVRAVVQCDLQHLLHIQPWTFGRKIPFPGNRCLDTSVRHPVHPVFLSNPHILKRPDKCLIIIKCRLAALMPLCCL